MDFNDYLKASREAVDANPSWRRGQAYWNVLQMVRPDVAAQVHGTHVDPFYVNERIFEFLNSVAVLW